MIHWMPASIALLRSGRPPERQQEIAGVGLNGMHQASYRGVRIYGNHSLLHSVAHMLTR